MIVSVPSIITFSALNSVLLYLTLHFISVSGLDKIEFLFRNQEICGNPFSDAQWVPALDACQITCNEANEICLESDDLGQRCKKLPQPCQDEWGKVTLKGSIGEELRKIDGRALQALNPPPELTDFPDELKQKLGNQPFGISFTP